MATNGKVNDPPRAFPRPGTSRRMTKPPRRGEPIKKKRGTIWTYLEKNSRKKDSWIITRERKGRKALFLRMEKRSKKSF